MLHLPNPVPAGDQGCKNIYVQVLIRFFEILDSLASSISLPEDVTVLDEAIFIAFHFSILKKN